jgi:heat shock protein HslJ
MAMGLMAAMMAVALAAGQAAPGAPTIDQLKGATYKGINDTPVTLKDGAWEGPPVGKTKPRVVLQLASLEVGAITADGAPEAVVLLRKSSGGTGVFTFIAIVADRGGTIENVATTPLGDREQVRSVSIVNRRIVVDVIGHGPGEPMCCPTQKQRRTWYWTSTGLKELPREVRGLSTVADLESRTWTLRSLDNDQPLPKGVTVTLNIKNRRVDGTGGCNTYGAAIADGNGARGLEIGRLSSTRMFCAGAASDVEAKYLAALQTAFQFGFFAGDLALTYKDGSAVKTLMFSGR